MTHHVTPTQNKNYVPFPVHDQSNVSLSSALHLAKFWYLKKYPTVKVHGMTHHVETKSASAHLIKTECTLLYIKIEMQEGRKMKEQNRLKSWLNHNLRTEKDR